MTRKPNLRDKIEELKHMQKRTFTSIASGIGFTDAALRRLLDRNDCKLSTLYKLAEVLNVSVIELLLSDDEIQNFERQLLGFSLSAKPISDLLSIYENMITHRGQFSDFTQPSNISLRAQM